MIKILLLFVPFIIAGTQSDPYVSYLILWFGSVFIYAASVTGFIVPLQKDLAWYQQLFRPVFFTNTIFIGFTVFSTIFYFFDLNGYVFLDKMEGVSYSEDDMAYLVKCQQVYNLGHAAYVTGLLLFSGRKQPKYKLEIENETRFIFTTAIALIVFSQALQFINLLNQLSVKIYFLGYVALVISTGLAKKNGNDRLFRLGNIVYMIILFQSFFTGRKEDSIVLLLLYGIVMYPYYKRTITILGPVAILMWFYIVPIFANTLRQFLWYEGQSQAESIQTTVEELGSRSDFELSELRWKFFVDRFSEVKMFETFIKYQDATHREYSSEILGNTLTSLIPRFIWPEKPETEYLAMDRVYEVGIVEEGGGTSAKTKYMVDAYLIGGLISVLFFLFILGALTAYGSVLAEYLFGGYFWGSAIMFTGLFNILWVGNSFEFVFNAVFYSFVLLYLFFLAGRTLGIIKELR